MHIESLKFWHWTIIGLLVGLAVAAVRIHAPTPMDNRPGISLLQFDILASSPSDPAHPYLRNLTIYPPVDHKNFITGEYLHSNGFFSIPTYLPFQLNTPIPYRLPRGPSAPSPTYSIRDFLAKANPSLQYHYLWHASDTAQYLLFTAASTLLIGGLWPVILRLLIGAGFGRKTPPEPAYDLDRFSHAPEPPPAPEPQIFPEVLARVEALDQALTAQLAAAAMPAPANPLPEQPTPVIVSLSDTPLEPQAAPDTSDDPKDYQGEYYPVARPTHKQDT